MTLRGAESAGLRAYARRNWAGLCVFGLGLALFAGVVLPERMSAAQKPVISFGVLPQQAPSHLLDTWGPLLAYLERYTGYRFLFKTAPDFTTFSQRLATDEYDFAYMNPYQFILSNDGDRGYQAVVRASGERVRGVVIVRRDSPMRSVSDLDGKTLAYPAPGSFVASMLPRAHLAALGIHSHARYVASHESVYLAVVQGRFPAGGGMLRTLKTLDPAVRKELRVLWATPSYTAHAIAAHARVPDSLVDALRTALIGMHQDGSAGPVLQRLNVDGFEAASNADWDDVRALDIDRMLRASGSEHRVNRP